MIAFADTGFYVALLNPRDKFHRTAISASDAYRGNIVTTEFILVELGNYLGAFARRGFLRFYEEIRSDAMTEIVPASSLLFGQAVALYAEREDKHWSLTDCSSFIVMRDRDVSDTFTFDRHFEQAGFRRLIDSR